MSSGCPAPCVDDGAMTIDAEFIPIHTRGVKVAISVPDAVCQAADEMAAQMGVSRSQFFATAARRYLDELDRASVTASIDEAVTIIGDGRADVDGRWVNAAARRTFEANPW